MDNIKRITERWDQAIALCLYALIFFIPISIALIEWFTGLAVLFYILKRTSIFIPRLRRDLRKTKSKLFELFLKSYAPIESCLNRPIALWMIICLLSIVFSQNPLMGIRGFLGKVLENVFLYFAFIEVMAHRRRIKIFSIVLLASSALICWNGIHQYINVQEFIRMSFLAEGRVSSSFRAANDFAAYLVIIIPILISLSLLINSFVKSSHTHSKSYDYRLFFRTETRILIFILILLSIFCLGVTFSRGGWLVFFITLIIIGLRSRKFMIIFLIGGTLFASFFISKFQTERVHGKFLSLTGRAAYWEEASNIIKDYPLLGAGLNNYSQVAKHYKIEWAGYPHNCYLQIAAETGLLGLASFLWILFALFKDFKVNLARMTDPFLKAMLFGTGVGFVGFLIHSFFDTFFYSVQLGTFMWVIIGMVIAISKVPNNSYLIKK